MAMGKGNRMNLRTAALCLVSLLVGTAQAETSGPTAPLPPIEYVGAVAGDELYTQLKSDPLFAHLDKNLVGSAITLRVTHSFQPTSGGMATGLASAIWAGGTLGLLPVVVNSDLVITYEIIVNGTVLTTYSYQKNFTKAVNIYSTDTTYGLGKDGLAWAKDTATQFTASAAKDEKLAALQTEYKFYFGALAK
jgi:hypothetical protein